MHDHIALMRTMGYRYGSQAVRFAAFDRFLQTRPDLVGQPLRALVQAWSRSPPTVAHAWSCAQLGADLSRAVRRIDPTAELLPRDPRLKRQIQRTYLATLHLLAGGGRPDLQIAQEWPAPRWPLLPATLYSMFMLAYCAGLRLGEILRLNVSDVLLPESALEIRNTKFFKSRRLPLAESAFAALRAYPSRHAKVPAALTVRHTALLARERGRALFHGSSGEDAQRRATSCGTKAHPRSPRTAYPRYATRLCRQPHARVVPRRDRSEPALALPGDLSGAQEPAFDAHLPHHHSGVAATGVRAIPGLRRCAGTALRRRCVVSLTPDLPRLLRAFFYDWATQQRNLSPHTIRSYRDTWRLFLRFAAARCRRPVSALGIEDLNDTVVLAFLDHGERDRHGSIGTRNCRLAALRAFFAFLAAREPAAIVLCTAVLRVPNKRAARPALCYLDTNEVEAILAQPDRRTLEGQRDHALLSFLYNTGARIQEALDLHPSAIRFSVPATVRLFGKGRKERICPLWPETVQILRTLLSRQPRPDDTPLFVNRYGQPLGASGMRFKLAQYVESATRSTPSLASKDISPHTFRHSAAVGLIAAGVDIAVIRSWLGHASIDTTAHYAQANLATKRSALERLTPQVKTSRSPRWRRDKDVLAWLDAL